MDTQIKAIIFDCFGVLVDDALSAMCQNLAKDKMDKAIELMHASHRGLITPVESNQQIAALFGMSMPDYQAAIRAGEVRNEALLRYILELKQDYKTALLSNIGKGSLARRFTDAELATYFDAVVASGEVGYAKPEPEVYEIAAEWLGVRLDECVFTDDKTEFCEAARAVGMSAIEYHDFGQFKRELADVLAQA